MKNHLIEIALAILLLLFAALVLFQDSIVEWMIPAPTHFEEWGE